MTSPFSFSGDLGRLPCALGAGAAFFAQHVIVFAIGQPAFDPWFWLNPMRTLDVNLLLPTLAAGAVSLAAAWIMVALSYRRAAHAVGPQALALLAITPLLQVLVIVWFTIAPARGPIADAAVQQRARSWGRAVAIGLFAGIGITAVAVAFSSLVLGIYGYGVFVATPFIVGFVASFVARRDAGMNYGKCLAVTMTALLLGAAALIGIALEGAICLLIASPLIAFMGAIGALAGGNVAGRLSRGRDAALAILLLPLMLTSETLAPPRADYESVNSIEINAAPADVWRAITRTEDIPAPNEAPFRWGLAYPVRWEMEGEGVGALRRGVFSTGIAYERVTEWRENEALSFVVLSDPPPMRELSPYENVGAPHLSGYFRTRDARFTITPLANGRTRLRLATAHELDLAPGFYWTPIAQWITHANKQRVLAHFRQQAETPR